MGAELVWLDVRGLRLKAIPGVYSLDFFALCVVGLDFLGEELALCFDLLGAFGEQLIVVVKRIEAFEDGSVSLRTQAEVSLDVSRGHAGTEQSLQNAIHSRL